MVRARLDPVPFRRAVDQFRAKLGIQRTLAAPRGFAVGGEKLGLRWPAVVSPVLKGWGKERRVDPLLCEGERARARNTMPIRQDAAPEAELRLARGREGLGSIANANDCADHEQQRLVARLWARADSGQLLNRWSTIAKA